MIPNTNLGLSSGNISFPLLSVLNFENLYFVLAFLLQLEYNGMSEEGLIGYKPGGYRSAFPITDSVICLKHKYNAAQMLSASFRESNLCALTRNGELHLLRINCSYHCLILNSHLQCVILITFNIFLINRM
jgi:hypothetical protein